MQALLAFLKKYFYWLLFLGLEAFSVMLLFWFNTYQASAWYTAANSVAGRVNGWYAEAVSYINLKQANTQLTAQNTYLQTQVAALREELDKVNRKEGINERSVRDSLKGYEMIHARVISNSLHKEKNYIVINKGEADGVKVDMGVVGGGGVVGIVFLTSSHYSLVLPVLHVKSNISCRVRHSQYFGSLQWTGGSTTTAYLYDIPRYARIGKGAFVETSGYSAIFPPGIFVGRVTEVSNAPDGLSLQLKVNLGTDFANLTDVDVVYTHHKAQVDGLYRKLDEFETKKK
ncbi:MAG: rod shape-determining protein MreC [Bacteroidaceae bacterium]|nr:rod shape-determining protein MreC [Bacteroidaceae bacterium]